MKQECLTSQDTDNEADFKSTCVGSRARSSTSKQRGYFFLSFSFFFFFFLILISFRANS